MANKKKAEKKEPFNLLIEPSVRKRVRDSIETHALAWSEAAYYRVAAEYLAQQMDSNWQDTLEGDFDFNYWLLTLPPPNITAPILRRKYE